MPKKGEKLSEAHRAAVSAALKGKTQTPEHVAARQAGLAKVRAATVRVSRNDAAMLEAMRTFTLRWNEAVARREDNMSEVTPIIRDFEATQMQKKASHELIVLAKAWLDGEDVLLAKLSQ